MENTFIRYWAQLNLKYGNKILYDLDSNDFYFVHQELTDNSKILSPLQNPTERINVRSANILNINQYLNRNISENSENIGGFLDANKSKISHSKETDKNFLGINKTALSNTLGTVTSELDAILNKIRNASEAVQRMTENPNSNSALSARRLVLAAENKYAVGSMYDLKNILERTQNLHAKIDRARHAGIVKQAKIARKKLFATIKWYTLRIVGTFVFTAILFYGIFYGMKWYAQKRNAQHTAAALPAANTEKINRDRLNELINLFEKERGVKLYEKRREKIFELVNTVNAQPITIIDSVANMNWHQL